MRAWAGVLLFIVVYFTTSPAWQKNTQKPEGHYPAQKTKPKSKTIPWQRLWLHFIYWSIKAEIDAWQLREQGRASLIEEFVREVPRWRAQLQRLAWAVVPEEQSSSAASEEREGEPKLETWISFL